MVTQGLNQTEVAFTTLQPFIRTTPVLKATHFSDGRSFPFDLHLKLELHQISGSFKARGVLNKILSCDPKSIQNGIFCASGGNHGRAVAQIGAQRNIPTTAVLPTCVTPERAQMIKEWGATTVIEGQDLDEANSLAQDLAASAEGLFIHPYADPVVTCGQGTLGVELLQQLPRTDTVFIAIGGGGLISGVATYLKSVNPNIKIVGVEPKGCPTLYNSLKAGKIVSVETISTNVNTLSIRRTCPDNFKAVQSHVDEVILVSDDDMKAAAELLWYQFGIAAEMSGVASFAGLLSNQVDLSDRKNVCALICGQGLPHDFLRTY